MAQVEHLDVGLDAVGDRLWLLVRGGGERHKLLLTRRLTKRLLRDFAQLIARTVPAEVPEGAPPAADQQEAAAVFEHLEALGERAPTPNRRGGDDASADGEPETTSDPDLQADPGTLLTALNVRSRGHAFDLELVDETDAATRFALSRADAHRLLAAIYGKTLAAEWDLEPAVGWLAQTSGARQGGGAAWRQ